MEAQERLHVQLSLRGSSELTALSCSQSSNPSPSDPSVLVFALHHGSEEYKSVSVLLDLQIKHGDMGSENENVNLVESGGARERERDGEICPTASCSVCDLHCTVSASCSNKLKQTAEKFHFCLFFCAPPNIHLHL